MTAKITPQTLHLVADGKTVELHGPNAQTFALNKALLDPKQFQAFSANPKQFAAGHGINIDDQLSQALSQKLTGVSSIGELQQITSAYDGGSGATIWAVAQGAYSISSSKAAVVF